jgi:cytidine deaminase
MIARVWSAQATPAQAPAYVEHLRSQVLPTLRKLDGFGGARLLERTTGAGVEILVVTFWRSLDSLRRFAPADLEEAVVAEEAIALLTNYDRRVRHYEVVVSEEERRASSSDSGSATPAEIRELIAAARQVQGKFTLGEDFSAAAVGAAVRSRGGQVYTGVCLDLACGIGFCAEHAAIAEMLKHRESEIDAVVAVGKVAILAPCGRCRELMTQINPRNLDCRVILAEDRWVALRTLLPEHWLDTLADTKN